MNNLERLFLEWREQPIHKARVFITDGPIDDTLWEAGEKKILFLGKEAYSGAEVTEGWDLPTLVRENWKGPKGKFWWTLGYWALGIRHTTEHTIPMFPGYDASYDPVRDAVMRSAIVNIKKSGGLSYSQVEDLKSYVESDGGLIVRQVDLLNPQVVLFCNTWSAVRSLWPEAREVSQYIFVHGSKIFINYWHPANQFPDSAMFYALCAIYQNGLRAIRSLDNR